MQLPGVVDAVVLGIPDDYWGEAVHAVIIKEPRSDITAKDVIDHCSNSLAGYKKPKGVDFVTEFPISGYGKILRREIRAEYWKNHEKTIGGSVKLGTEAQL
jgi:acyl-CoA synthetase (AMP-forming)/AMP-acid ligase II